MPDLVGAGLILRAPVEEFQRAAVLGLRAHGGVEARRSLNVVVEDVRAGCEDGRQGLPIALEVRDQDFDARLGAKAMYCRDRPGEDARPAVWQFVAID